MTDAIVALGSNLGARVESLTLAVEALNETPGVSVLAASPWYESIAHTIDGPNPEQPRYLNGVVRIETSRTAEGLLDALAEIEVRLGRPAAHERWSDRTIDLDLVLFGQETIATERLTVPHPRAHERAFVLRPWLDLDPDAVLPGRGSVRALLTACPDAEQSALTRVEVD